MKSKNIIERKYKKVSCIFCSSNNVIKRGVRRTEQKVMRGFHGSMLSASAIMKGYEIYYNFIRKHQRIGCCPYELAIPDLELGRNRWLDLIKMSKV